MEIKTVGQFFRDKGMAEPNIAVRAKMAAKFDICPEAWYVDSPEQNKMLLAELMKRYASGLRNF